MQEYWDSYSLVRVNFINELSKLIEESRTDIVSVLEYGSHVSPNFRRLKEKKIALTLELYAVEPNKTAIEFLNEKLPEVKTLTADDEIFCKSDHFPDKKIDICFTHGVFLTMSPDRVNNVLEKFSKITNTIVVLEEISNIYGDYYKWHYPFFLHPWEKIFFDKGYEIKKIIPLEMEKHTLGIIVAEKM